MKNKLLQSYLRSVLHEMLFCSLFDGQNKIQFQGWTLPLDSTLPFFFSWKFLIKFVRINFFSTPILQQYATFFNWCSEYDFVIIKNLNIWHFRHFVIFLFVVDVLVRLQDFIIFSCAVCLHSAANKLRKFSWEKNTAFYHRNLLIKKILRKPWLCTYLW